KIAIGIANIGDGELEIARAAVIEHFLEELPGAYFGTDDGLGKIRGGRLAEIRRLVTTWYDWRLDAHHGLFWAEKKERANEMIGKPVAVSIFYSWELWKGKAGRVAPRTPLKPRGCFATFAARAERRALPAFVSRNGDGQCA